VDRLGAYLLSQSERPLDPPQMRVLDAIQLAASKRSQDGNPHPAGGVYHKILSRQVGCGPAADTSPQWVAGAHAPDRFIVRENGVKFELSFNEGYSVGLFLDQRDNRRRFLTGHIAAGFPLEQSELLNCFAYTCGFSVCAALAGARTTSLDLSRKYLDWGKRNFTLNHLDPAGHDFIYGDTFDWLKRFAKKGRSFAAIALDPPTFSRSRESGVFQAEKDYGKLVAAALPALKPGGALFAATNAATLAPEEFLAAVTAAIRAAGRKILQRHYVPQPPDFPVTRDEPGYLKTVWLRIN
jgi:23S rRNA (cytosine1962-C5)-methyltransferase